MAMGIAGLLLVLAASVATGEFLVAGIPQSKILCVKCLLRSYTIIITAGPLLE